MIGKFLKNVFKAGKKAKKSIEDSVDFIDDVLEKEYITGSIDKFKEGTGKAVETAGTMYQKTRNEIDTIVNSDKIQSSLEKLRKKGRELSEDLSEGMEESARTLKNVMNEGKSMVDKIFDEEEE